MKVCHMESKMQEQIEGGLARMEELEKQYDLFSDWYLSSIPDCDETLIDRKYLDDRYFLQSPVEVVSAMWLGWRMALGL